MSTDTDGSSPKALLGVSARHLLGLPRVMGLPPDLFVRPRAAGDDEVSEWTALRCLEIKSLELMVGPDPEEVNFFALAAEALGKGFDVTFHAPSPDALDLREFIGGADRVGSFYQTWLGGVAKLPLGARKPVLVVHGVNAPGTGPEVATEARTTTVGFLRWLASACAEQAVRMQMAFELRPRREGWTKVGSSCAEVLAVVEEAGLPDLGICWDIGHGIVNLLRKDDDWPPPPAFLERTVHTHLHLATTEEDHLPITSPSSLPRSFGGQEAPGGTGLPSPPPAEGLRRAQSSRSPAELLREALALLARAGYRGILNLECHFTCWEEVAESAQLVSQLWEEAQTPG